MEFFLFKLLTTPNAKFSDETLYPPLSLFSSEKSL
ncbi:hypothetical protein Pint_21003 [Pistacia integerrima]|uniref:Uncharacterized protein n=1 Tax=Pistacia integerrima TaxID=434235 RepID=A0ACC0XG64_9ROSI|nr:hypothetical protein Pint_21003 [Pistacia integerrima]